MNPFQGEMMTCAICGRSEKSDPHVESNWRAIQMDEFLYYVCPNELPPDGSSKEAFATAYKMIFVILSGQTAAAKLATKN